MTVRKKTKKTVSGSKKSVKKQRKKSVSRSASKKKMPARKLKEFRDMLLRLRERLTGQIDALKGDSLKRLDSVVSDEDGTDAFERQLALNLVSAEHDSIFEIDEALRRIEDRTYGVCEQCNNLIEGPRLKALPFVRMCIRCQSEIEKSSLRFRPEEG